MMESKSLRQRFDEKYQVLPNGCWEWTGYKYQGYGRIGIWNGRRTKSAKAYRVAFELFNGPIPQDSQVLHSCDNPSCVNPAHLRLGTHLDNMRDKNERGRQKLPPRVRGSGHHMSKLTESDVLAIRQLAGTMSQSKIADQFGISFQQVSMIVLRKNWKHVA